MRSKLRHTLVPLSAFVLAVPLAPPASAGEFVPGTGSASAGVARISMRSSGATIGLGLAQTRARFAGAQGNAESAGVDLGLFETVGKAPVACGTAPATAYANPLDSRFGALVPPSLPVVSGIPAPAQPTPLPAAAVPPTATAPAPQALEPAPTTVTQIPVAAVCRSTHSDEGCARRNGLLAAWLALVVVALLAGADWLRRRT